MHRFWPLTPDGTRSALAVTRAREGFAGLAPLKRGLVVRILNAHLAVARRALLQDDPRFCEANRALVPRVNYLARACPLGPHLGPSLRLSSRPLESLAYPSVLFGGMASWSGSLLSVRILPCWSSPCSLRAVPVRYSLPWSHLPPLVPRLSGTPKPHCPC